MRKYTITVEFEVEDDIPVEVMDELSSHILSQLESLNDGSGILPSGHRSQDEEYADFSIHNDKVEWK